jgi:hypothetical protein
MRVIADRDITSVPPHVREVTSEENGVENLGQEEYRSLRGCFKALFGIPFGPADLLTLIPPMTS